MNSRLLVSSLRRLTTTAAKRSNEIHPGYFKIKGKQAEFQVDNGLRVHQRGGAGTKVLYGISLTVAAIGCVDMAMFYWKSYYPNGFK